MEVLDDKGLHCDNCDIRCKSNKNPKLNKFDERNKY